MARLAAPAMSVVPSLELTCIWQCSLAFDLNWQRAKNRLVSRGKHLRDGGSRTRHGHVASIASMHACRGGSSSPMRELGTEIQGTAGVERIDCNDRGPVIVVRMHAASEGWGSPRQRRLSFCSTISLVSRIVWPYDNG